MIEQEGATSPLTELLHEQNEGTFFPKCDYVIFNLLIEDSSIIQNERGQSSRLQEEVEHGVDEFPVS